MSRDNTSWTRRKRTRVVVVAPKSEWNRDETVFRMKHNIMLPNRERDSVSRPTRVLLYYYDPLGDLRTSTLDSLQFTVQIKSVDLETLTLKNRVLVVMASSIFIFV